MSEIGADIIGTLFSADYIGEPKHVENIVVRRSREWSPNRSRIVRPVSHALTPIKETHVRWNFEFFECPFPDSFRMYISRYVYLSKLQTRL